MAEKPKKSIRKSSKKKRKSKYDEKIVINATFQDLVKAAISPQHDLKLTK